MEKPSLIDIKTYLENSEARMVTLHDKFTKLERLRAPYFYVAISCLTMAILSIIIFEISIWMFFPAVFFLIALIAAHVGYENILRKYQWMYYNTEQLRNALYLLEHKE